MICLSPGVIYSEVTIDTPQGSGEYITIRNANLNFLPPAGVRISPLYAPNLPIIDGGISLMRGKRRKYNLFCNGFFPGSRFRFVGLYFVTLQNTSFSLIQASKFTDHIIVDQCYSQYSASKSGTYTIILGSLYGAIVNSYIEGTHLLQSYCNNLHSDRSIVRYTFN